MADQEFLASFAVEIDEAGVARLQSILQENRDLAAEVAAAFEAATAAIKGFETEFSGEGAGEYADKLAESLREPITRIREMYDSSSFENSSGVDGNGGATGTLDLTAAREELTAFREEASEPVSMSGDASGMTSAAIAAYNSI